MPTISLPREFTTILFVVIYLHVAYSCGVCDDCINADSEINLTLQLRANHCYDDVCKSLVKLYLLLCMLLLCEMLDSGGHWVLDFKSHWTSTSII